VSLAKIQLGRLEILTAKREENGEKNSVRTISSFEKPGAYRRGRPGQKRKKKEIRKSIEQGGVQPDHLGRHIAAGDRSQTRASRRALNKEKRSVGERLEVKEKKKKSNARRRALD